MQITVDTTKDSKEEIKKAIRLLSEIIGEEAPPAQSAQPLLQDAMSMFSESTSPVPSQASVQPEEQQDVDIFGNVLSKHPHGKDDKKMPKMDPDKITIIPY